MAPVAGGEEEDPPWGLFLTPADLDQLPTTSNRPSAQAIPILGYEKRASVAVAIATAVESLGQQRAALRATRVLEQWPKKGLSSHTALALAHRGGGGGRPSSSSPFASKLKGAYTPVVPPLACAPRSGEEYNRQAASFDGAFSAGTSNSGGFRRGQGDTAARELLLASRATIDAFRRRGEPGPGRQGREDDEDTGTDHHPASSKQERERASQTAALGRPGAKAGAWGGLASLARWEWNRGAEGGAAASTKVINYYHIWTVFLK